MSDFSRPTIPSRFVMAFALTNILSLSIDWVSVSSLAADCPKLLALMSMREMSERQLDGVRIDSIGLSSSSLKQCSKLK